MIRGNKSIVSVTSGKCTNSDILGKQILGSKILLVFVLREKTYTNAFFCIRACGGTK